jgi:ribosomal protein S18 acetylase RimI-like enzyme
LPQDKDEIAFTVEPLAKRHKRTDFSCGSVPLDRYLKNQASQDAKRGIAAPFVLVAPVNKVVGYYTLSSFSIELDKLPLAQTRKLPKYPVVPATLLGRLATDQNYRGMGLGEHLLMDALHRSYNTSSQIASYAVVVDAKDGSAVAFYKKYDFAQFPDRPNRLFLPMSKIKTLFS